jgi:hypothetical protein
MKRKMLPSSISPCMRHCSLRLLQTLPGSIQEDKKKGLWIRIWFLLLGILLLAFFRYQARTAIAALLCINIYASAAQWAFFFTHENPSSAIFVKHIILPVYSMRQHFYPSRIAKTGMVARQKRVDMRTPFAAKSASLLYC